MSDLPPVGMPRKAMLLAAGKGTRLRPLTNEVPKCMVKVGGKPVLEHNIEWLRSFGINDLIINLSHLPEVAIDYFGDGSRWDVSISYSVEDEPLGTAGGVKKVESFFENEPFFLWYGDNLSTCNLDRLHTLHWQGKATATIALFHRDDPTSSGIVGLDQNNRITRILEKPKPSQVFSNLVSAGIFILEPDVLDYISDEPLVDFGYDVFPRLLDAGEPLFGYRLGINEGLWWIDTPDDLKRIQTEFVIKE